MLKLVEKALQFRTMYFEHQGEISSLLRSPFLRSYRSRTSIGKVISGQIGISWSTSTRHQIPSPTVAYTLSTDTARVRRCKICSVDRHQFYSAWEMTQTTMWAEDLFSSKLTFTIATDCSTDKPAGGYNDSGAAQFVYRYEAMIITIGISQGMPRSYIIMWRIIVIAKVDCTALVPLCAPFPVAMSCRNWLQNLPWPLQVC